jgi:ketosteroid isomerase-like protein
VREADGRVIATGTASGRGRGSGSGSGIPLQYPTAMVVDFGDGGLIVRARIYFDDAAKALMGTDQ